MYNVVNLANLNGTVKFIRRIKSQINTWLTLKLSFYQFEKD